MEENCARKSFYDKKGCRISGDEWEKLYQNSDYSIVGRDYLNGYLITTYWNGIDVVKESDEPVIFETQILCPNKPLVVLYYASEKVAKKYHNMLTFFAEQHSLEEFIKWRLKKEDDN